VGHSRPIDVAPRKGGVRQKASDGTAEQVSPKSGLSNLRRELWMGKTTTQHLLLRVQTAPQGYPFMKRNESIFPAE
jgi:hypothetical protein